MRRFLPVLCLLLIACGTTGPAKGPVIKDLQIEGAKQVKAGEIKNKIYTAETSWLPFTRKHRYDPDIWRTDLRRIERYYREMGFYQALVVEDEVKEDGKDGVKLRVKVVEGDPTIIDVLEIQGLDDIDEAERAMLTHKLPLQKGEIFVESRWETMKATLEARLREQGYATAKVDGKAEVDLVERKAKIPLTVTLGPRYKFGETQVVAGEKPRVESWRVKEKAEKVLVPGKVYSESARDEAQERVVQMGVFGAAQVKNGVPDPSTATMPMVVDVREAPFHSLKAGFGVGVDQARNEIRGIAEYTDRDFLGSLRRLNVRGLAGYAFIPGFYSVIAGSDEVTRSGPIGRLTTELEQPRVFHPDVKANLRVEGERRLEPAYSYFAVRNRVGAVWQPTPSLSIFPSYNLEAYWQDSGTVQLAEENPALLFGCPKRCILSFLEQVIELDKRDDKQEPKFGYLAAVSFQEGGGFLGGSFDYFRVQPEIRGFITPDRDEKLTFSGKLKVGTLLPLSGQPNDSPIVSRFYSGGSNMMRGFGTRRLSPMLVVEAPSRSGKYQGQALPIGGNGLLESSVEARYNAYGPWVFAAFVDSGIVTSAALEPGNADDFLDRLQLAFGGGVRYLTPIGPLRIDLAYRPNVGGPLEVYQLPGQDLTYPSPTGCFGIGGKDGTRAGSPEGPCALHLSIGEAF